MRSVDSSAIHHAFGVWFICVDPTKILVCSVDEEKDNAAALPGSEVPFRLMSEAFPDPSRSFVPKESAARARHSQRSASVGNDSLSLAEDLLSSDLGARREGEDVATNTVDTSADAVDPALAKARADDMTSLFLKGTAW
jgi:hypothetical protein